MAVIGIDLGGTRVKTGIVRNGRVEELHIRDVSPKSTFTDHLPFLKERITFLKERLNGGAEGIGVAFPGLVDSEQHRIIETSGKYRGATTVDLPSWAKEEFGLGLRIDNDARLACLGEWQFGAGKKSPDMVLFMLGTGIGTSAIINNKILRGQHFQAGILGGHFVIDYTNTTDRCSCGKFGCLESVASTWRISQLAAKHPLYASSRLSGLEKIDIAGVFSPDFTGDYLAEHLRQHCLNAWALGIVNLIHAYDPSVVVVGGGVMHSQDVILPALKKIIRERAWCPSGIPEIVTTAHPDTAALLGTEVLFSH